MKLRNAIFSLGMVVMMSHVAALAQGGPSVVGKWRSATINNPNWPLTSSVLLTISEVDASQRASGRFSVNTPGASGGGAYTCPNGTVAGTFDGVVLSVASKGSNLCPERVWNMKLQGEELTGTYRGLDGNEIPMTFTRR